MDDFLPDNLGESIAKAATQAFASMADLLIERYEYTRVPWREVNGLARQGWLLLPVQGGYDHPAYEPLFVMSRKLGPADDAADLLEQAAPKEYRG